MVAISVEITKDVEELKDRIGWSWLIVSKKFEWSPYHLNQFRTLRMAIPDDAYRYIREVAAAVESVRPISVTTERATAEPATYGPTPMELAPAPKSREFVPADHYGATPEGDTGRWLPQTEQEKGLARAGYHPASPAETIPLTSTKEVHVMLLDDIAVKIAKRYRALQDGSDPASAEMSPAERAGAIWMVGELATELGVSEEVRKLISMAPAPPTALDWTVPGLVERERRPLS